VPENGYVEKYAPSPKFWL